MVREEKSKLGEALKAHRLRRKMTLEQAGQYLGKSKQMVGYYESGKNQPSYAVLSSLAELYEVSFSELTEDGWVEPDKVYSGEKAKMYFSELPEKDAEHYIPYYDVEITAGKIELYFDDVEEVPEGYVYAPQYKGCVMCNVKGDSMYDRIFPGARLYVWYMNDKKYIDFGQVFLIVLPGERLLKYIYPHPSDETRVILRSHNRDKYPDWPVEKVDIIHLFKVKGYENQNAI